MYERRRCTHDRGLTRRQVRTLHRHEHRPLSASKQPRSYRYATSRQHDLRGYQNLRPAVRGVEGRRGVVLCGPDLYYGPADYNAA